ncbi:MAG: class I SAM-dependent methyltransferase [Ignavibacteriales bacterium]|nr:class I SAM-dependent methyltransferase [Ignavibacteriales bacterium]
MLPFIGKIISKDEEAYTYLPESVSAFDTKVDLENICLKPVSRILKTLAYIWFSASSDWN